MNEPDNDFDALRKLLSLKQHEVPPPGYFSDFSAQVVSRIRSGDAGDPDTLGARLLAEAPWLFRLISNFQDRPALAGVFASALCMLLVAGIVLTDNPGATPQNDALMPAQTADTGSAMASASAPAPSFLDPSGMQAISVSSTNPVLSLQPTMSSFGSQNPLFKPVGYPQ